MRHPSTILAATLAMVASAQALPPPRPDAGLPSLYGPFPAPMQAELDKRHYDAGTYVLPAAPFRWEPPPVLSEVDVPGSVNTNGINSRFHVIEVALSLEDTYQHFYRSFIKQGLWVSRPEHQMELGEGQVSLTGYDPNHEISYTVILMPDGKARTGVIMGEAFWKSAAFKSGPTFAPVFPAAQGLVTQTLENGRSMAFRVRVKKADVEAFYKAQLSQQGYVRQPDTTWTRGTQVIHLVMKASEEPGLLDVALVESSVSVDTAGPAPTAP